MRIAYLCNRYPAVSHSFVRREIAGVEAAGHRVDRYTVRAPGELLDDSDRAEAGRTVPILGAGVLSLGGALLSAAVRGPLRFAGALRLAISRAGWSPKRWYVISPIWPRPRGWSAGFAPTPWITSTPISAPIRRWWPGWCAGSAALPIASRRTGRTNSIGRSCSI